MRRDTILCDSQIRDLTARGYSEDVIDWLVSIPGAMIYANDRGYSIVDDRGVVNNSGRLYVCDGSMRRIFQVDTSYQACRFGGDSVLCCVSSVYSHASAYLDPGQYDAEWLSANVGRSVAI